MNAALPLTVVGDGHGGGGFEIIKLSSLVRSLIGCTDSLIVPYTRDSDIETPPLAAALLVRQRTAECECWCASGPKTGVLKSPSEFVTHRRRNVSPANSLVVARRSSPRHNARARKKLDGTFDA